MYYQSIVRSCRRCITAVTHRLTRSVRTYCDEIGALKRGLRARFGYGATGAWGEQIALQFLRQHGCQLLACNWRTQGYEADLIMLDRRTAVVVEVKTRHISQRDTYPAHRAVDDEKRAHLTTVSRAFSRNHGPLYRRLGVRTQRIDTVEVYYCRTRLHRHRVVELSWHRGRGGHVEESGTGTGRQSQPTR